MDIKFLYGYFVGYNLVILDIIVSFTSALTTPSNDVTTMATQEPVTGTDLFCYECSERYSNKKKYDPLNAPCRNNVTTVGVRQCLAEHKYCVTEKQTLRGWSTVYIARNCASDCYYGCKSNGYAITVQVCFSCCRTPNCNTDSGAVPVNTWGHLVVSTVVCALMTVNFIRI